MGCRRWYEGRRRWLGETKILETEVLEWSCHWRGAGVVVKAEGRTKSVSPCLTISAAPRFPLPPARVNLVAPPCQTNVSKAFCIFMPCRAMCLARFRTSVRTNVHAGWHGGTVREKAASNSPQNELVTQKGGAFFTFRRSVAQPSTLNHQPKPTARRRSDRCGAGRCQPWHPGLCPPRVAPRR